MDTEKEDISIDFSSWKQKAKRFFKKDKGFEQRKGSDDDVSLDVRGIAAALKANAKWLVPLLCILVAMAFSMYLRTMPQHMPITDEWAQSSVHNFYRNQIESRISQQYPNLPPQNKNALVEKEFQNSLKQNKNEIDGNIAKFSQQYKSQFRDDNGTLYLLGIDPWHYYRTVYNVLLYSHEGTALKDGIPWDYYFVAPLGREAGKDFHAYFGAFWHRFLSFFGEFPLMFTFFFVGTIFAALTVIPAFFIGKRISGNSAGGFFTAMLLAVSPFFVSRTTGESSDTDVYSVFFPVLITWFFIEALEAKELKKKLLWTALTGIATGLFSFAWGSGWWYIFDFIIAAIGIYIVYLLIMHRKELSQLLKSAFFRNTLYFLAAYIAITGIVVGLFYSFSTFVEGILGPFTFLKLKAITEVSLWPNIRTTIAELNVAPMSNVINQLGGQFLFFLGILGIFFTLIKKDSSGHRDVRFFVFLALWLASALFATRSGVRFILQGVPVISIALGAFMGITWHYVSRWIAGGIGLNRQIANILVFFMLALLLIQPARAGYSQAYHSVPSVNDAWYNTLEKIDREGGKNAIINSWWDFGHWFKAIADRPVTFDGAAQTRHGAHWIGKALITDDEKHTVGILRMLNCGQNSAFNKLNEVLNDTPRQIALLDKIVTLDRKEAINVLKGEGLTDEQAAGVLQFTHCVAPTDYFITSDDMIGKAGVWGHFGSWNFTRSLMYQKAKGIGREQGVQYLAATFALTKEKAQQYYDEIQNNPADGWISPWPNYISGLNACQKESPTTLLCTIPTNQGAVPIRIDLATMNATIQSNGPEPVSPFSLVYATKEGVQEKKFTGNTLQFSALLVPSGENYLMLLSDPLHADSTFTKLFFFNGHGMKCFSRFDEVQQFTGGKVSTWVVDYDCKQENNLYFLPKEQVLASHILVSTQDKSEDEALQLIKEIEKNVTPENFAVYAERYSQDPGSKSNGGELGWFSKGVMIPEFEQAAFALKEGEISQPVRTQFGWHLIYVREKKEE